MMDHTILHSSSHFYDIQMIEFITIISRQKLQASITPHAGWNLTYLPYLPTYLNLSQ